MCEAAHRIVRQGCVLVAVGGDHSISFPLAAGVAAHQPIEMVHVDAHADFWDELDGSRLSGASQLRRIAELPDVLGVTALGLRNVEREEANGMRELGVRFATTLDLLDRGPPAVVDKLVPRDDGSMCPSTSMCSTVRLVPGTTLPEPDGLSYRELRDAGGDRAPRPGRGVRHRRAEPPGGQLRSDRTIDHLVDHPPSQRTVRQRKPKMTPHPRIASCATGRFAGHPGVVSDPSRALLFREGGAGACSILANAERPVRRNRAGGATIAFLESDRATSQKPTSAMATPRSRGSPTPDERFATTAFAGAGRSGRVQRRHDMGPAG